MGFTRLRLPSPALVLSCFALFAALGGGAYAASSIGSSSISWHNATLLNHWTRSGTEFAPASYAKDSLGVVHLRGGISGGTSYTKAFALPHGLRPNHVVYLPAVTNDGVGATVIVFPDGRVVPYGGNASAFTSLDGVSFVAGQ
jgi:hypothetical protein